MRILVISDIHANLTAFEAVLAAAGQVDSVWCLGDVLGYGPDPNECVERLRGLPSQICLIGNHDAAALGKLDLNTFNYEARYSARWTQSVLTHENRQFLLSLPEKREALGITLAHGSPRSPIWEYVLDRIIAYENFEYFQTRFCFVGHTHVPLAFTLDGEKIIAQTLHDLEVPAVTGRMILNPGSVGQPRDRDPRAAYAVFNPETSQWRTHRIEYDIASVQARMRQFSLPPKLVRRLADGW